MPDYIPRDDAGRVRWMTNWAAWLTAHGLSRGFTEAEIARMNALAATSGQSLDKSVTKRAEARASVAAKNADIRDGLAFARPLVQRFQNHPDTSDADRAAAGVTVPDRIPTSGGGVTPVELLPPPQLILDFSIRRQVAVHWGVNPANEHENARPAGVIGCEIQYARGGIPEDEAQWVRLDNTTESPLVHITHDAAPITHAYRARYIGKNLKFGSYSAPAVCTVSA